MTCPKCGSSNYSRDMVDVGPGVISAGPLGCHDCHYVHDDLQGLLKPKFEIDMIGVKLAVAQELYRRRFEIKGINV